MGSFFYMCKLVLLHPGNSETIVVDEISWSILMINRKLNFSTKDCTCVFSRQQLVLGRQIHKEVKKYVNSFFLQFVFIKKKVS